jgi:hypothetical protein
MLISAAGFLVQPRYPIFTVLLPTFDLLFKARFACLSFVFAYISLVCFTNFLVRVMAHLCCVSSRRLDNWYTALGSRRQRQGNPTELYGVVDGSKHECKGVTGSDGRRYNVWIKKHVPIEKDEEGVLLMEAENACSLDRHDHLKLPEIEAKPMLQD